MSSAKERVLAVYPDAYLAGSYSTVHCSLDTFDVIRRSTGKTIGSGRTQSAAWEDAASRLPPAPPEGKP